MFLSLGSSRCCCCLCHRARAKRALPPTPPPLPHLLNNSETKPKKSRFWLRSARASSFVQFPPPVTTRICVNVSDPADTALSKCDCGSADRCLGGKKKSEKFVLSVCTPLLLLRRNLHLPFKRVPCTNSAH